MLSNATPHDRPGFALLAGACPAPRATLAGFAMQRLGSAHSPSILLSGARDALLLNAQFLHSDAVHVAQAIQAGGKHLRAIYVSSAEPHAYFGLGVLRAAFPLARILASGDTVEAIRRQAGARVAHWGGILKHNAPRCIVLPQAYDDASLPFEDRLVALRDLETAFD